MPPKREAYPLELKLEAIARVRGGQSQSKVGREFEVPESAIRGWLKDEDNIRDYVHDVDSSEGLQRKRARKAQDPKLDKALFNWFVQENSAGTPVSGEHVKIQAAKIHKQLHDDNEPESSTFVASTGFLNRWKRRHAIQQLKISGESRSCDHDAADGFPLEFRDYIREHDFQEEQVYNADETALFHKMLPDRTLGFKNQESKGFKMNKERITLLFCTNKTGSHKLKPLVIGRSGQPRCFHHVNLNNLPVLYRNSKNSWMTGYIFKNWFFDEFVPAARKHMRKRKMEEKACLTKK